MDRFIAYSPEEGLYVYRNANEQLAKNKAWFDGYIYLGYEKRFLQHFADFVQWLVEEH